MTAPTTAKPASTTEQRRAIETRDVSVALSAGAGCGKTYVLTKRYLAHFDPHDPKALQPSELGKLVAITFTERAAREMRSRIRESCFEQLRAAPEADAEYWADLLRSLDNARISTIHSFCGALLRSRAVEAGVDPTFDVLDQAQADTLLSEVIDDTLRRLVAGQDEATFRLAVLYDLGGLKDLLRRVVLDCSADQLAVWLEVSPAEQVERWEEFLRDKVIPAILDQIVSSTDARKVLAVLADHLPDHPTMRLRREVLLEKLGRERPRPADSQALLAELDKIRESAKVQGAGTAKVWPSAEAYETFKNAATSLRKAIDEAKSVLAFDPRSAFEAASLGRQLLGIAGEVQREYATKKQSLGVLDFNDLMIRATQLLTAPANQALRKQLSSQIRLLLVDEFQDTDPTQVELVKALCGDALMAGKLFFVGDYKQSIYRFRGADPQVFRDLREGTPQAGRLSLTRNFRSQPAILEFVNALFWHDLGPRYEPLRASRAQVAARPAVEFLWAPASDDDQDKADLRRREADWIARRLRGILDSAEPIVWDAEAAQSGQPAARPARPGDVAILFRALSNVEIYEEALRRHGIDYYLVGGHAFYAQQEIFDVLNLLRTLNSTVDLVSLVGVLRSGFFALADETIFWLAQHPDGLAAGLFAGKYPPEISQEEQRRAQFAAATIRQLRDAKDRLRICELLELALELTGYDAVLLDEFLGERKLANLRKLVEQARSFDRQGFFALADFIAQLAEFVVRQPEEPLAATHSENTNVVRLMTIHQSKGLEFPIVIVPDVDRPSQHRSHAVHFDPRLGTLLKVPTKSDPEVGLGGYELWRFLEKEEDLAETNRLLYVATTRAADYLILSSGVEHLGDTGGPWTKLLARRFDLLSGRVIGDLPADEPRPQVRVTIEQPNVASAGSRKKKRVDLDKVIDQVLEQSHSSQQKRAAVEPVSADVSARRLYSFSRLAGTLDRQDTRQDPNSWEPEPTIDPRNLGNLVHATLAAIDFEKPGDVAALVRLYAERQQLADPNAIEDARTMIERFLGSRRAQELASARESHAEVEFLLAWPHGDTVDQNVVLGGFIDRLYQDQAGDWHVLDFKTNRVEGRNLVELSAAYEMQMLVYALSAEKILGRPPKSLVLHFLRTGAEHSFVWDDAARRRVVTLVQQGLAAAREVPVSAEH